MTRTYETLAERHEPAQYAERAAPVKMWTRGVPVEKTAEAQLLNTASMPFIFKQLAVMPDVHYGKGSTIGSVIPTKGAIIPAAVGVDIGCGMMAWQLTLDAERPARQPRRHPLRYRARGAARLHVATQGRAIKGGWDESLPAIRSPRAGARLDERFKAILEKHPENRPQAARASSSARSAPAITSSRSASTRTTACG